MHIIKKISGLILAVLALIYLPLPAEASAGQIAIKEEINDYESSPDIIEEQPTDDAIPETGNQSLAPIFLTLAIFSLGFATVVGGNE